MSMKKTLLASVCLALAAPAVAAIKPEVDPLALSLSLAQTASYNTLMNAPAPNNIATGLAQIEQSIQIFNDFKEAIDSCLNTIGRDVLTWRTYSVMYSQRIGNINGAINASRNMIQNQFELIVGLLQEFVDHVRGGNVLANLAKITEVIGQIKNILKGVHYGFYDGRNAFCNVLREMQGYIREENFQELHESIKKLLQESALNCVNSLRCGCSSLLNVVPGVSQPIGMQIETMYKSVPSHESLISGLR